MDILFLIIPILLYKFISTSINTIYRNDHTIKLVGKTERLPIIISILTSAQSGIRRVLISSKARSSTLMVNCAQSNVGFSLKMPSSIAKKNYKEIRTLFATDKPHDATWDMTFSGGTLSGTISGSSLKVSNALQKILLAVFGDKISKNLGYEICSHYYDTQTIQGRWKKWNPGDEVPSSVTTKENIEGFRKSSKIIKKGLRRVFLWPIAGILAYYLLGLEAAIAAIVTVFFVRAGTGYLLDSHPVIPRTLKDTLPLITPIAGITFLWMNEFQYFQHLPSLFGGLGLIWALYALVTGKPLIDSKDAETIIFTATSTKIGVSIVFAVAIAINENLISTGQQTLWIWYYSFLRLEIFVGLMASAMPSVIGELKDLDD